MPVIEIIVLSIGLVLLSISFRLGRIGQGRIGRAIGETGCLVLLLTCAAVDTAGLAMRNPLLVKLALLVIFIIALDSLLADDGPPPKKHRRTLRVRFAKFAPFSS